MTAVGPGAPGTPDVRALTAWSVACGVLAPGVEVRIEPLAGGSSNPTYRVRGGDADLVLRTPPVRGGLPTAHDMDREYRFQSALAGSAVPVAPMVASCADPSVIGVPFYLMGRLDGVVHARAETVRDVPPDVAAAAGRALAGPWPRCTRWIPSRWDWPRTRGPSRTRYASCGAGGGSGRPPARIRCRWWTG